MTSYNKKEFETMQQEAIRRVHEMQKKAQGYVNNSNQNNNFNNSTSTKNPVKQNNTQEKHTQQKPQQKPQQNRNQNMANPFAQLFGSNLGGFNRYKNNPQPKQEKKETKLTADEPKNILPNFLKDISLDEEKVIIMFLIYLLYKNGADVKLLLALGYLLM